jgi:hypothetical protein
MSILRINSLEHIPEFLVSSRLPDLFQLIPILPVWRSIGISHLIEESIDIEPCTATEDRDMSLRLDPFDDRECLFHKINHRKYLTRIYHIDHMMGDSSRFFRFYLASADIHMTVDLSGVCRYDLSPEIFGDIE